MFGGLDTHWRPVLLKQLKSQQEKERYEHRFHLACASVNSAVGDHQWVISLPQEAVKGQTGNTPRK